MKISELQKLDFLLKKMDETKNAKNFKISFELNGQLYSGDFIPELYNLNSDNERFVQLKDVTNPEDDKYKYVKLTDCTPWFNLFKKEFSYDKFNGKSTIGYLERRSNNFNSYEYLQLLLVILEDDNFKFNFNEELPFYIYNVKSLTNPLPINFMKVNEDTEFEFVSLVPKDTI